MSKASTSAAFAAGVVAALVIGGGSAVAATGGTFVLGRSNTATTTTTLTNSTGTALSLSARPGTPPLAVNSATGVRNLNADQVDGRSASAFALRTGSTGVVLGTSASDADRDPSTATCPRGTVATGGGGAVETGALAYSGPDFDEAGALVPNSWHAQSSVEGGDALAWVVCYNPAGAVPGAATRLP